MPAPWSISVYHCPIEQALAGSGLDEADEEFDPQGYSWGGGERCWRARETRRGVTTVGHTRTGALERLAEALDEYEKYNGEIEMGEFWWVQHVYHDG